MYRLIITTAALLAATHLPAAILTVGNAGGCDHASVQAALDAAANGDEIRVRTDTYNEVVSINKSLRIIGGFAQCGDATPASLQEAVLSAPADSNAPVVTIDDESQVELQRLRLTGANHVGNGGGLWVGAGATVDVGHFKANQNTAHTGGGIYVSASGKFRSLGMGGVEIVGNNALVGAGIYVTNAATLDSASNPALFFVIRANTAGHHGGGIYHGGHGTIRLANTRISDNQAGQSGGGLYSGSDFQAGLVELIDCRVLNNSVTGGAGGGLRVFGNTNGTKTLRFVGGELRDNVASATGGGASIGGGLADAVDVEFNGVLVQGNQAGLQGGAIHATNATLLIEASEFGQNSAQSDGGALWLSNVALEVRGGLQAPSDFVGNTSGRWGGAIRQIGNSGTSTLGGALPAQAVWFADNEAVEGGAIHITSGTLALAWPLQFLNNLSSGNGGAIHASNGAEIRSDGSGAPTQRIMFNGNLAGTQAEAGSGGAIYLDNATLEAAWLEIGAAQTATFGNTASLRGGGLALIRGAQARLYNSVVGGNLAGDYAGAISVLAGGTQPTRLFFGAIYADGDDNPAASIEVSPCLLDDLAPHQYCAEIEDNHTVLNVSSGILADGSDGGAELEFARVAILGNGSGAVVAGPHSTVALRNVLVSDHAAVALGAVGSHIGGSGPALLTLDHVTVTGNGERTIYLVKAGGEASLSIHRSILWGNDQGLDSDSGTIDSGCNITQSPEITGLQVDPRLATSDRGPYRLRFDSPALDLCADSLEASDLDGAARPANGLFDAGAFEGVAVPDSVFANRFEAN